MAINKNKDINSIDDILNEYNKREYVSGQKEPTTIGETIDKMDSIQSYSNEPEVATIDELVADYDRRQKEQDKISAEKSIAQGEKSTFKKLGDAYYNALDTVSDFATEFIHKPIGRSFTLAGKTFKDVSPIGQVEKSLGQIAEKVPALKKIKDKISPYTLQGDIGEIKIPTEQEAPVTHHMLRFLQPVEKRDSPTMSFRSEGEDIGVTGKAAPFVGALSVGLDVIPGGKAAKTGIKETVTGTKSLLRVIKDTDNVADAVKLVKQYGVRGADASKELSRDIILAKNSEDVARTFNKLRAATGKTVDELASIDIAKRVLGEIPSQSTETNRAIRDMLSGTKVIPQRVSEVAVPFSRNAEKYLSKVDDIIPTSQRAARAISETEGVLPTVKAIERDIAQAGTQGAKITRTPKQFFETLSRTAARASRESKKITSDLFKEKLKQERIIKNSKISDLLKSKKLELLNQKINSNIEAQLAKELQRKTSELISRYIPKNKQNEAYKLISKGVTKDNIETISFKLSNLAPEGARLAQMHRDAFKFAKETLPPSLRIKFSNTIPRIKTIDDYKKFIQKADELGTKYSIQRAMNIQNKERKSLMQSIKSLSSGAKVKSTVHPAAKTKLKELMSYIKERGGLDALDNETLSMVKNEMKQIRQYGVERKASYKEYLKTSINDGVKEIRRHYMKTASGDNVHRMGLNNMYTPEGLPKKGAVAATKRMWNKARDFASKRLWANISSSDTIFDRIDGNVNYNGPMMNTIKRPIDYAIQNQTRMYNRYITPVVNIVNKYKLNKDNFNRIGIVALRNQGNDGMKHLLKTLNGDVNLINSITLTPQEKELYDEIVKGYQNIFPSLERTFNDVHGKTINKVDKGYTPIRVKEYFDESNKDILNKFSGLDFNQTKKGGKIALGRVGGSHIVELDAMKIFDDYMNDATYIINVSEPVKIAQNILRDNVVERAIGTYGKKYIDTYLGAIASGGKNGKSIKVVDSLRQNLAIGTLGFRPTTILKQTLAALNAIGDVSPKNMAIGIGGAFTKVDSPVGKFLYNPENFPELWERAGGDVLLKELKEADSNFYRKAQRTAMEPIRFLDQRTAASIMFGKYLDELEKAGKQLDLSKVDDNAAKRAMEYMRRTQVSAHIKDSALAFSTGAITDNKSLDRMLLTFMQYQTATATRMWHEFYDLGLRSGNYKMAAKKLAQAGTMVGASAAATTAIKSAIAAATGDEYDPETTAAYALMNEALSFIPGESMIEGFVSDRPMTVLGSTISRTQDAIDFFKQEPSLEEAGRLGLTAGPLVGIPTGGIEQTLPKRSKYKIDITVDRDKKPIRGETAAERRRRTSKKKGGSVRGETAAERRRRLEK